MARADLHLHSRASTDTGSWFLRRAVLPESFTDPREAYAEAKARGMDYVTLSDHNTIDGALEIAHHPDAFISVEATTEFPEDRTPLHVLVWGIGEAQWRARSTGCGPTSTSWSSTWWARTCPTPWPTRCSAWARTSPPTTSSAAC